MREIDTDSVELLEIARIKWKTVNGNLERLVTPDTHSFNCQPDVCDALCCRRPYIAGMSIWDIELLEKTENAPSDLLVESGVTVTGKLETIREAQKSESTQDTLSWLPQDTHGKCIFLRQDNSCGCYSTRPNSCAQYPYTLLFIPINGRKILSYTKNIEELEQSVHIATAELNGTPNYVPLIVRDSACPGFTGKAMGKISYNTLML